jgi:hypothetical protein
MCSAWPEGKASLRLPENGTPWTCPMTVRRSGRVWSNRSFKPWGSSDAATVTSRAWLPAHRSGSPRPREASQPTAARTRRTFSSAPHVSARATSSGAGAVLRAIDRATATSALVGWTVTGKLGPRLRRLADNLAVLNMTEGIGKVTFPTHHLPIKVLPSVEIRDFQKSGLFMACGRKALSIAATDWALIQPLPLLVGLPKKGGDLRL